MATPTLTITVCRATDLKNVDKKGKSDPYVILELNDETHTTSVKKDNLNPTWDESFTFKLPGPLSSSTPALKITVKDKEKRSKDKLLGRCSVRFDALRGLKEEKRFHTLQEGEGRIEIKAVYDGPSTGGTAGGAGDGNDAENAVDAGLGEAGLTEADRAKMKESHAGKRAFKRSNVSYSTRPSDFQIRVRVIEARSLSGAKSLRPICKATIMNQRRQTRAHKSTNKPWFNELFFFNFHEAPSKLFEETLRLDVVSSRTIRSDALIGSFFLDLAMVYEQPMHSVISKWVMLTNPKDRATGVMGYVKLSIIILGDGDELPEEPEPTPNDDDDVEENLLRPPGVTLESVDMVVQAFRGDDMPPMDPDFRTGISLLDKATRQHNKALCDPYLVVSFAGRKAKTHHVNDTYSPEWMEALHVAASIPSMADRLQLQLRDWDGLFNQDDTIATAFVSLSQISNPTSEDEMGFLPCFGPCYVNFYGSMRDFSMISGDHVRGLNDGIGEGCAYRGRVLLQIDAQPGGNKLEKPREPIDVNELKRVQPYLKTEQFLLRVELVDLNMLSKKVRDGEVRVEVSIGNEGNIDIAENDIEVGSSITAPAAARFDGSSQWFISWDNRKPCLQLESSWEDICYRIFSLNQLRSTADILTDAADLLHKTRARRDIPDDELQGIAGDVKLALDTFATACAEPLPELPSTVFTRLDHHLMQLREKTMKETLTMAQSLLATIKEQGDLKILDTLQDEDLLDLQSRIQDLCYEPQLSIPDVIIWVLTGDTRTAYLRVPVDQLMFHESRRLCAKEFGRVQTHFMRLPKAVPKDRTDPGDLPAQIQFRAWFGRDSDAPLWPQQDSEQVVLAESYENEAYWLGKGWTAPVKVPHQSDALRKKPQPREKVILPPGWLWKGDWQIDPEIVEGDPEANVDSITEEIYEHEHLNLRGKWKPDSKHWTSLDGEPRSKEEFDVDEGWQWETDWKVDTERAVDHEGWEYHSTISLNKENWYPAKKRMHNLRRRRWTRVRVRDPDYEVPKLDATELVAVSHKEEEKGWLYSTRFHSKHGHFYVVKKKRHTVRTRRWRRERIRDPDFNEEEEGVIELAPEQLEYTYSVGNFFSYGLPTFYQFRAHIYQARELPNEDASGESDPYIQVAFGHHSGRSIIVQDNSCPTFDQTIFLDNIAITGSDAQNAELMPRVVLEVFDHDNIGNDDFLGRIEAQVQLRDKLFAMPPRLQWYPIMRGGATTGEVLAAFEVVNMMDIDDFPLPPKRVVREGMTRARRAVVPIPRGIRPTLRLARIDVLCWGLRKLAKYRMSSVDTPHVTVECGGFYKTTPKLKNVVAMPNFTESSEFKACVLSFEVHLPLEVEFSPPLLIRVYDNRKFGRKPLVGTHRIACPQDYLFSGNWRDPNEFAAPNYVLLDAQAEERERLAAEEARMRALAGASETSGDDSQTTAETIVDIAVSAGNGTTPASPTSTKGKDPDDPSLMHEEFPKSPDEIVISPEWADEKAQAAEELNSRRALIREDVLKERKRLADEEAVTQMQQAHRADPEYLDDSVDWWIKYLASQGKAEAMRKYRGNVLTLFNKELERVFDMSEGAVSKFELFRGRGEEELAVGIFKGNVSVVTDVDNVAPGSMWDLKEHKEPRKCTVRLYIVEARDLQPQDTNGGCDAYVVLYVGNRRMVKDSKNYVPASTNPVFGRSFDVEVTVPQDAEITLALYDHDNLNRDDLVGQTVIDVEERLMARSMSLNGVPQTYRTEGMDAWRFQKKPSEILAKLCEQHGFPPPAYSSKKDDEVVPAEDGQKKRREAKGHPETEKELEPAWVNTWLPGASSRQRFFCENLVLMLPRLDELEDEEHRMIADKRRTKDHRERTEESRFGYPDYEHQKEGAALAALRAADLVPEHVETRSLYSPSQPGITQGQLKMWVEVFPHDLGPVPAPIDITPTEPKPYVLRIVIWNTFDVLADEKNMAGEEMSDIYVRCFMRGLEKRRKKTDTHYRSLNGEGNFNWRMNFEFDYLPTEEKLVVRKKRSLISFGDKEQQKLPPTLALQVWDNDLFSPNDFIGNMDLDLTKIPRPFRFPKDCKPYDQIPKSERKYHNLFKCRRMRGVFPCGTNGGESAGKVEMELELLTAEEAEERPAGNGRSEPNQFPKLPKPERPATSFLWITNPLKSFRYILWRNYKWYVIIGLIVLLFVAFIVLLLYNVPQFSVGEMFSAN